MQHRVESRSGAGYVTVERRIELLRSTASFYQLFADVQELTAVTYSYSPEFVTDILSDEGLALERLTLIVGDSTAEDWRERLSGNRRLAEEIHELLATGQVAIHMTRPPNVIHVKAYIGERADGRRVLVHGSPNLSQTAWKGQQKNQAGIFETDGNSVYDAELEGVVEDCLEYTEPFMHDLQRDLEAAEDPAVEDRIWERWLGPGEAQRSERAEARETIAEVLLDTADVEPLRPDTDAADIAQLAEAITDETATLEAIDGFEREIRLDIRNFEELFEEEEITHLLREFNLSRSETELVGSSLGLSRLNRQLNEAYPAMQVDPQRRSVQLEIGGHPTELTLHPEDPTAVDAALAHIEEYIETVETIGRSTRPTHTMAHFYEGIIYAFWAPFVTHFAEAYARGSGEELDKDLPFLYIFGENDSGKGMFLRFIARLISQGSVVQPTEGSRFTKKFIRTCRAGGMLFPLLIDDVDKTKVERDILKTYWSGRWTPGMTLPTMIFTSNDGNPKSEFRTRMKMLTFDVLFATSGAERQRTAELIARENNLFGYFSHLLFDREIALPDQDDRLEVPRAVFRELYAIAGRDPPDYFPEDEPAEHRFDLNREAWRHAYEIGSFTLEERNDVVIADFSESFDGYQIYGYVNRLPATMRYEQQSGGVVFYDPEAFYTWTEIDPPRKGLLGRLMG